jgi:hypothetical protein
MIDSSSSVNPPCIGVEIPVTACKKCQETGHKLFENAVQSKEYTTVLLTDRVNKVYKNISM